MPESLTGFAQTVMMGLFYGRSGERRAIWTAVDCVAAWRARTVLAAGPEDEVRVLVTADVLEPAVHHSIVLVDVEGFGARHRTRADQAAIRHGLYQALQVAFSRSRIGWDDCYREDCGDGVLILVPPQVPKTLLAAGVPGELAAAVYAHNQEHGPDARMRLRLALHGGEVLHDAHGVTGTAVNLAFRLLEARPLKQALAASPGVLAAVSSAWFYEEVIRHTQACAPATWRRVLITVKETREDGWVSLPDAPYPAHRDAVSPALPAVAEVRFSTRDVRRGIHVQVPARRAQPVIRQLPADTALFAGRDDELDRLLVLPRSGDSPGTVVISAIDGMGGIGKTALAVRAAHHLAGHFPDGQLFIDLYGFTEGTAPRDPGDALATLLSSLGVPPGQIPGDLDARAALYRGQLAGTRTLILLDNAADEAQVRPLLPATDTCLVLITSRRRLKALDDALPVSLDVLAPEEAVALLRKAARLDEHPRDEVLLARAAELCGRLPLALLIAGALLRSGGKAWNLPVLINRLAARQPGRELAGFTDETRSLDAVFDLSYRNLPEHQRLLFHRLGLLTGPEIDAYAAAALLETHLDEASRLLQHLADHSLLTDASPGRYRLHDLIRAHARTLAATLDPEPQQEAAQDRLLHYYAHTAQTASLPIARLPRPGPRGLAPACAPGLTSPEAAWAWLRTEYPNLQAAHTHATTLALEGHAIALAAGLAEILQTNGPWTRALEIHQAAANAAARLRQPTAYATALTDLGRIRYQTGDYSGAADAYARALEIYRQAGNRLGEANALTNLGRIRYLTENLPAGTDTLVQALEIYRQAGNRLGEANALTNLARLQHLTGTYPEAGAAIMQAVEIFRQAGNRLGEANALNDLGRVRYLTSDYPGAADAHARALEISRQIGHRHGEANALTHLGRLRQKTGDFSAAEDVLAQALEIFRQIGNRLGEANALTYLGRVRHATGDLLRAAAVLAQALEISRQIGHCHCGIGALHGLGRVRYLTGDFRGAADAQAQMLEICHRLGDRFHEAWALNHYAATIAATGDRHRALALYQQSLAITREVNMPAEEAFALEGIADHHLATGNPAQGAAHLRQALQIYQRLGLRPDTERVTARLAGLAPQ